MLVLRKKKFKRADRLCPKCGVNERISQGYCRECWNGYMREWRARQSAVADRPGYSDPRYETDPEYRKKRQARSRDNMRKFRGIIQQQPCRVCGNPKAQMHHLSYAPDDALDWLCARCHADEHIRLRREQRENRFRALAEKYKDR